MVCHLHKIIGIALLISVVACSSSKNGQEKDAGVVDVVVKTMTSQDSYPGIESNLRFTRSYNTSFSAKVEEEISFNAILVDSVRLPIQSIRLEGDVVKNEGYTLLGDFTLIEIQTSRQFYNPDARFTMIEETDYELSGQVVGENQALLEYEHFGTMRYVSLGTIEKAESQYHT